MVHPSRLDFVHRSNFGPYILNLQFFVMIVSIGQKIHKILGIIIECLKLQLFSISGHDNPNLICIFIKVKCNYLVLINSY